MTEEFEKAREETIPILRAEAGLPSDESDDDGDQDLGRYVEVLESAIVGQRMAINTMREIG